LHSATAVSATNSGADNPVSIAVSNHTQTLGSATTVSATNSGADNIVSMTVSNSTQKLCSSNNVVKTHIGDVEPVTIDDGSNFVDEEACIMKLRSKMCSAYDTVQVSTTLCQSLVLYRNQNYYDWLMDAPCVAFIELHGDFVFGDSNEQCMHCYGLQKKGSVPPSIQHSKE
jgi:hypothetical protein